MIDELVQAVRESNAILFVGAGVSMNLGLPSYEGFIEQIAEELGYDAAIYRTLGDYLSLAEFYELEKGNIGRLRSWMDRTWHAHIDIGKSEIHRLIVDMNFPIIYTTNYDTWLERAYDYYKRAYVKIGNVGDLTKVRSDRTQIVKFHGDFEDDESLVLTESSYLDRLAFESPLDIKLRADLLGRSVLFIGYSLSDINIRYMFYRLNGLWKSSDYEDVRPKSFMFLSHPNPVQQRILVKRGIEPIVSKLDNAGLGLLEFLKELAHSALGRT